MGGPSRPAPPTPQARAADASDPSGDEAEENSEPAHSASEEEELEPTDSRKSPTATSPCHTSEILGSAHSARAEDSDVLSEATPRPRDSVRSTRSKATTSEPAHSASGEGEAAASSRAKQKWKRPSCLAQPPPTDVPADFERRSSRQDALKAAQTDARTLSQLQKEILTEYLTFIRNYNAEHGSSARMLPQIWSDDWKNDEDTRHFYHKFRDLQPFVAARQAEDMIRVAVYGPDQPSTSTSQQNTAEQSRSDEAMDTSEAPVTSDDTATSQLDISDTPSDLDYRTDKTRSPQYERELTPVHPSGISDSDASSDTDVSTGGDLAADANATIQVGEESVQDVPYESIASPQHSARRPQDPRRPRTVEEDVDEITVHFRTSSAGRTVQIQQPFRNPSPPPARAVAQSTNKRAAKGTHSVPDADRPTTSKQAAAQAGQASTSKPKTTVKMVKQASHKTAGTDHDSSKSRSSTGSKKRSHVRTGETRPPPAKRQGSRSPARKPPASLTRHLERKRTTQHRYMVPLLDGCVYKDIAIDMAKTAQEPTNWTTMFDNPNCPYELIGLINHMCVPSTYLPPQAYQRVRPTHFRPYVDQTFDQALIEQTIIPWNLILTNTLGAAPTYWEQGKTETREYLRDEVKHDKRYRDELKVSVIGPVGYDFRNGAHLITGEYTGQTDNLIRYGRIARNVRMPLVIHVEYDELPEGIENLHHKAIQALRQGAQLSSQHRIHLVAYKATALDLLYWLEEFPRTTISLDVGILNGLNQALAGPPDTELYRHARALKTFFTYVQLERLSLHSACPMPLGSPGSYRTPVLLITAAEEFEKLTGTPRDRLLEANAANLVTLYDLNPDLLDRSTTTTDRRDAALGPRLARRDLSFFIRAQFGQAPRADLNDQDRSSSRRRASIGEASPAAIDDDVMVIENAEAGSSNIRSRSSTGRERRRGPQTPPPTRRGRSPGHRDRRNDPAKNKPKKGSEPAHSAGGEPKDTKARGGENEQPPRAESHQRSQDPTKRTVTFPKKPIMVHNPTTGETYQLKNSAAVPVKQPPGSALQGRVLKLQPGAIKDAIKIATQQPAHYQGLPKQVFLSMTEPPPPNTGEPRILIRCPDHRFFKTQPVHDGNLPREPSIEQIRAHFEQCFDGEAEEGKLRPVHVDSLSSVDTPIVRGEPFIVEREPEHDHNPWDPMRPCRCQNVNRELHQTVEEFGLITKKKWANKDVVLADKTGHGMKRLLADVMSFEVQSFGQMIFLKYADRLKGNNLQTGAVLRFMFEILSTADWSVMIDCLRDYQRHMVLGDTDNPWPTKLDIHHAAEHWICYCPEAYVYVLEHLSGPVSFTPKWLSYRNMPTALYELLDNFDGVDFVNRLRNRVYSQYCLRHIEAIEAGEPQLHWVRFETTMKRKRDLCEIVDTPTVCFVDHTTQEQYGDDLHASVTMIRVDTTNGESALYDIRHYFPTDRVTRVVFWMAHDFMLKKGSDLCPLLSELCHHYEEHFSAIEKVVIMPPYVRRLRAIWTDHALGTYLQRDEILPNTRVALNIRDLQLWDFDHRSDEAREPPSAWPAPNVDEEGVCTTTTARFLNRHRFRTQHGLDLWIEPGEGIDTGETAHSVVGPSTSSGTGGKDDMVALLTAALPSNVVTPEVERRLRGATDYLRSQIAAEAKKQATLELKPQLDRMDAVYNYLLQQEQTFNEPKIAKRDPRSTSVSRRRQAERSRSSSRSPKDQESEH